MKSFSSIVVRLMIDHWLGTPYHTSNVCYSVNILLWFLVFGSFTIRIFVLFSLKLNLLFIVILLSAMLNRYSTPISYCYLLNNLTWWARSFVQLHEKLLLKSDCVKITQLHMALELWIWEIKVFDYIERRSIHEKEKIWRIICSNKDYDGSQRPISTELESTVKRSIIIWPHVLIYFCTAQITNIPNGCFCHCFPCYCLLLLLVSFYYYYYYVFDNIEVFFRFSSSHAIRI